MNYMGGKWRQGPKIAEYVGRVIKPGQMYYEPFCGVLGSAFRVASNPNVGEIVLSDSSLSLINMWRAVLLGWVPPDVVSQETYDTYKLERNPTDPMTAYCGFGLSFGGKWFGGYARNGVGRNFAVNAKRSVMLKASALLKASVTLKVCDYRDVTPTDSVVYLDPPYAGRTKPHNCGAFDSVLFWEHTRILSENNTVLVTEFVAPKDFVPVFSWGDTVVRHHSGKPADGTVECLFVPESQKHLYESQNNAV